MLPEFKDLWQSTLGWFPSPQQQQQFEQLYQGMLKGNRQLNLTRITEPEAFWEKHLWDSLRGIFPLGLEASTGFSVIDIGTGAGFPGFPCAIALPQAHVTLLDSRQKKITYLNTLISQLQLSQVRALAARVEALGKEPEHRENYDFAFLRAVASAPVCAEYAFPLLKPGGIAVLYRGRWTEEEESQLNQALTQLSGVIWKKEAFSTPLTSSDRHCLYLKKTEPTKKTFPRAVGVDYKEKLGKPN